VFRPRHLREIPDQIREGLRRRGQSPDLLEEAIEVDRERREVIEDVEEKRHRRNEESRRIGELKAAGKETQAEELIREMSDLKESIEDLSTARDRLDERLRELLLRLPNRLHDSVPEGDDEEDNRVEDTRGSRPSFDFEPRPHWEIGDRLGLVDFEEAARISGGRFAVHHGDGARLERALIDFMLDLQTDENGYEEVMTPVLVRPDSMEGTGQLPKFRGDMYRTEEDGLYLIPTAEVSLINLYRERILSAGDLPLRKTAWTPCFRREAGAHGRDTRGLMRLHQFNKVELVTLTRPEHSYEALRDLLEDARSVLDRLELPHRVVTLCAGETGFAAAKTYDVEVWIPSENRYREISSCSNCEGFQARRAEIQFREETKGSARYCHTLNGSGLAVGRCWVALLENYQQEDGSVVLPDALRPYFDGRRRLE